MEYTTLGDGGPRVSRIAFGCWAISGHGWGKVGDAESTAAVRKALDLGVDFFDTADVYGFGHSEELLAAALGQDRTTVCVATKGGVTWDAQGRIERDLSATILTRAVEASLRRLRLDCIPLYQIHWPDGRTPVSEAIETLLRFQEAGKIRWIGCCNLSPEQLAEARAAGPIVSHQASYNLLNRSVEKAVLPACRELGVSLLSHSSLAQGLLSGKYLPDATFPNDDVRSRSVYFERERADEHAGVIARLKEVALRHDKTPAQVAIRWILDEPGLAGALTGVKFPSQIAENAGAIDVQLSEEERRWIAP